MIDNLAVEELNKKYEKELLDLAIQGLISDWPIKVIEVRQNPEFAGCDQCVYRTDAANICIQRECIHAISPRDCFVKRKGNDDGTD